MPARPPEGSVPIKCPHCPEAIDVSWSPGRASWQHRGVPCPAFTEWCVEFVTEFLKTDGMEADPS